MPNCMYEVNGRRCLCTVYVCRKCGRTGCNNNSCRGQGFDSFCLTCRGDKRFL